MDWYKMAVFIYFAALTHFWADFLSHWMEKEKGGWLLALHCGLYTIFFIPLFWWLRVNFLWLVFVGGSHTFIDYHWSQLERLVKIILKIGNKDSPLAAITNGLDATAHLLALGIVAVFNL